MQPAEINTPHSQSNEKSMSIQIEDTYKYRSTDVAMYLVTLANEERIAINITKVQKLLYIIYGTYLRVYGKRLLNEHPQAWPYGPVFPTTRNALLKFEDLSELSEKAISQEEAHKMKTDDQLHKVVKFVLEVFGTWNAGQLSEWSHSPDSPWDKTRKRKSFKWGDEISDALILEYFESIIYVESKEKE